MVGSNKNYKVGRLTEGIIFVPNLHRRSRSVRTWPTRLGWRSLHSLCSVLDKTSMFTVFSMRDGKQYTHSVKPLQIIWNHLKQ